MGFLSCWMRNIRIMSTLFELSVCRFGIKTSIDDKLFYINFQYNRIVRNIGIIYKHNRI